MNATLSPGSQVWLHLGCLARGNWFKPAKRTFHLAGIRRAVTLILL